MLKLLNITKEYVLDADEKVLALNDVSLEFRNNEFVSILGPSGCGKTTLLNIIGGLDRYSSGDIQIEGISTKEYEDVDWDTYRNHRIGFVFQSYNLIPHMNILKNVALALTLAGVEREERYARALEALKKVGLDTQAKKRPNQLSGGQMQRVAIARALINNPDIILADEPTGALDSESGVQIMELLKEVANDRLVIMVTHNPQLAEQYSTRIVNLKDGQVVGDTMPYDSSLDIAEEKSDDGELEEVSENADNLETVEDTVEEEKELTPAQQKIKERKEKRAKLLKLMHIRQEKKKKLEKSSMKLGTAINLSFNNLISKKGRTLLTSIAGSIGIIGIILVLSLSNGATLYIDSLEESTLSSYPLTVNESSMDVSSVLTSLMGSMNSENDDFDEETIQTKKVLGSLLEKLVSGEFTSTNDLVALKKYIDENFDDSLATVKYNYGVTFNSYVQDPNHEDVYMKVNPYAEAMYSAFDLVIDQLAANGFGDLNSVEVEIMGTKMGIKDIMAYAALMFDDAWTELSTNQSMLDSQYELVGNSKWPTNANEIVICVNQNNTIYDYQLFMLGLKSTDNITDAIFNGDAFAESEFDVNELLGLEYKVLANAGYLENNGDGTYSTHNRADLTKSYVDSTDYETLKVVGVVRPKTGTIATSISGVIGYTHALTEKLMNKAYDSDAAKALTAAYEEAVANDWDFFESPIKLDKIVNGGTTTYINIGEDIYVNSDSEISYSDVMKELGYADLDHPTSIEFYCSSFDSKDDVIAFLDDYSENVDKINYSDSLSSMMSFVNTMANTITGVLVAFAAISLVVSTIMIAIIIYTSVLERRKEIGVLRSLGARKKDVSRVFLAEAGMLGLYSGGIGVIISVALSFAVSAILNVVFGIAGLMTVTWWHCIMMLLISVFLSMLAGFIPSRIAANKDPAIALRSE